MAQLSSFRVAYPVSMYAVMGKQTSNDERLAIPNFQAFCNAANRSTF